MGRAVRVRKAVRVDDRFRLGYQPALDGLRGISILAVMLYHSGLIWGGFLGVDVFFALSGFLITRLLMEESQRAGRISFPKFYARRALRLLPALLVLVAACTAGTLAFASPDIAPRPWRTATAVLLYVANWALILGPNLYVLNHVWSLAIEEQFYLLWPPILAALSRIKRRRGLAISVLAAAAAGGIPYRLLMSSWGASDLRILAGLDTHADTLLIGCAAGLLASWNMVPTSREAVGWAKEVTAVGGLALAALFVFAPFQDTHYWSSPAASLATAILILGLLVSPSGPVAWILERPLLVQIGKFSYGLYLWHFPIFYAFRALSPDFGAPVFWRVAVSWALSLAVALASFRFLEQPCLRLKERFTPRLNRVSRDVSGGRGEHTGL
jgi:peptidoglycan/LPS O-acetylase OafA/YrhL